MKKREGFYRRRLKRVEFFYDTQNRLFNRIGIYRGFLFFLGIISFFLFRNVTSPVITYTVSAAFLLAFSVLVTHMAGSAGIGTDSNLL